MSPASKGVEKYCTWPANLLPHVRSPRPTSHATCYIHAVLVDPGMIHSVFKKGLSQFFLQIDKFKKNGSYVYLRCRQKMYIEGCMYFTDAL